MRKRDLTATGLIVLGLLLAGCAPAIAPTPASKPAAPSAKAPVAETPAAKPTAAPSKVGAPTPTPPSATPKPAGQEPRYGGTLYISNAADPANFDIVQENIFQTVALVVPCYSGIVQHDPLDQTRVIGDLAKRWDVSPDGMSYTFYLQENVKWQDGVAFTAEDVRYTLDLIRDPPRGIVSPNKALLASIQKVEASGKDTLKVSLKYPSASFLDNLGDGRLVMAPKHVFEAKGNMKRDVVGTGPYKFKSYVPGSTFSVVKNPDYFIEGRPYLDGITWYIIPDVGTRFAALRTHRIQLTPSNIQGLTPSQAEIIQKDKEASANITVVSYPSPSGQILWMNTTRPPWSDIRLRRAVDLTLDRQKVVKVAAEGMGRLGSYMPPGKWGLPEDELAKMPGFRYPKDADIAEAKRLVADAGYAQGLKVPTILREQPMPTQRSALAAKEQLAAIGIELTITFKDIANFLDLVYKRDFDIAFMGASAGMADPDQLFGQNFIPGVPRNFSGHDDQRVADLYKEQSQALDEAKRREIVLNIQRRLHEIVPFSALYWSIYQVGIWKEVRGLGEIVNFYNNMKFQNVWLAK
ncbi:MAG: hypothetical protein HYX92_02585 [Chloroflexi bacterium]|nr:hypothetical protein [Chloroflexota bacterium]